MALCYLFRTLDLMIMNGNHAVFQAWNLRRRYGDIQAVDDFSLTVNAGEIVILVGPNGCGKTTSIEMALGFRRTEAGKSRILGLDPLTQRKKLSRLVGVQLQGASLHARVKLREQLQYISVAYGTEGPAFELAYALGLGDHLNTYCGSLSGGMQRRALVLSALSGFPQLAILDEPTSGVDPESRLKLWSVVLELAHTRGMTMLITCHDLIEAERYGNRVVMMLGGKIIANDAPAALIAMTGLTRVIAVRGRHADSHLPEAGRLGGVVLINTSSEVTFGFADDVGSMQFLSYLESLGDQISVTEQSMSLEDAYFYATTQQSKGKNDESY